MELNCFRVLSFAEGLDWQFPGEVETLLFDFKGVKHLLVFQDCDMDSRGCNRKENENKEKTQGVRSGGKPKVSATFQPRLEDNPSGKNLGEGHFKGVQE